MLHRIHILVSLFALIGLTSCASCSDDNNNKGGTCPEGQVFNPISGGCEFRNGGNSNNPTLDAGNNGTTTDGGGNNGGTTDLGDFDMFTSACSGIERRCRGNVVERCVNGMFETAQTCGQGLVCERGNCVPEDAGACEPGTTRCTGNTTFEICQADGMTWGEQASCDMGETCMGGECSAGCAGLLNEKSNVGCEYFTMRHDQATGLQVLPHTVVVSNPGDEDVTIQVDSPGGLNSGINQQTIAPLDSAVLNFPTTPMISAPGTSQNFYVIRSSRPVIATQFSPLNNPGRGSETSDASLLLPTNAIGQEYVIVGWRSLQPAGTWVDVVALEPNTTVTVESPLPLSGGSAGSVSANGSTNFTLAQSQVLHLEENRGFISTASRDVSGVIVTSDKPVAVYTGATIINIPDEPIRENPPNGCTQTGNSCTNNDQCCSGVCGYDLNSNSYDCADALAAGDHVEQQLFPVDTWGTSYVATPFFSRGTDDFVIYRVVGATDGTTVTLAPPVNGVTSFTLNRGEMRQFYGPDAFELSADNPVMVAQFMVGGSISPSGDGDPAFLLPPAIEQFRDSYVFLVPANYDNNYVTLIKKPNTTITLDGNAVAQSEFQPVGTAGNWEYALVNSVAAGVHTASSTEAFGVVVHGMDEYISYAFSGGIILPE